MVRIIMAGTEITKERERIDGYLISADIAFVTGFIIFFSLNSPLSSSVAVLSLAAVFFFLFSFLFSLWHRYRYAVRQHIYELKAKEINRVHTKELEQLKNLVYSIGRLEGGRDALTEKVGELLKASKQELEKLKAPFDIKDTDFLSDIIGELWMRRLKEVRVQSFNRPLDEKYAISKYVVDYIANKGRYTVFIFGVVCFFVALMMHFAFLQSIII